MAWAGSSASCLAPIPSPPSAAASWAAESPGISCCLLSACHAQVPASCMPLAGAAGLGTGAPVLSVVLYEVTSAGLPLVLSCCLHRQAASSWASRGRGRLRRWETRWLGSWRTWPGSTYTQELWRPPELPSAHQSWQKAGRQAGHTSVSKGGSSNLQHKARSCLNGTAECYRPGRITPMISLRKISAARDLDSQQWTQQRPLEDRMTSTNHTAFGARAWDRTETAHAQCKHVCHHAQAHASEQPSSRTRNCPRRFEVIRGPSCRMTSGFSTSQNLQVHANEECSLAQPCTATNQSAWAPAAGGFPHSMLTK